ncbi:MAG: DUF4126 domain-containing protein [Steroidobacteraceae bacterium]
MNGAEAALSVALGIALAASVGLRVFAPLLVTGIAVKLGYLDVSPGFAWLATVPAITMLAVATVAEVLAYSIPAVDNLLDAVAAPAALVAGVALSAAVMVDLPPPLKWPIAVIAGGGAAGIAQGITSLLRAKSTVLTGGIANPVLATFELIGALFVPVLALLAPLIAVALMVLFCIVVLRLIARRRKSTPV